MYIWHKSVTGTGVIQVVEAHVVLFALGGRGTGIGIGDRYR